jgi:hypothetical protein
MSKGEETITNRVIPNEVILIGKLKDENDKSVIELSKDGVPVPTGEVLKAVLAKYKFTRDTAPDAAAKAAGFLSGKFYQIQMGDPGGEMIILPNGNKVRRSRKTTDPGNANIFASNRATTFEEIKEELIHKDSTGMPDRIELVGGDPNCGKIRLKEYALMGFWDEFALGFTHFIYQRDKSGKLVPFLSKRRLDNGTFKEEHAFTNTGRHFVFEDEIFNLEGLRDNMRNQVIRWKKVDAVDNTQPEKGVVAEEKTAETAPAPKGDDEP